MLLLVVLNFIAVVQVLVTITHEFKTCDCARAVAASIHATTSQTCLSFENENKKIPYD